MRSFFPGRSPLIDGAETELLREAYPELTENVPLKSYPPDLKQEGREWEPDGTRVDLSLPTDRGLARKLVQYVLGSPEYSARYGGPSGDFFPDDGELLARLVELRKRHEEERIAQLRLRARTLYVVYVSFQALVLALAVAATGALVITIVRIVRAGPNDVDIIVNAAVAVGAVATGGTAGFLQKQASEALTNYNAAIDRLSILTAQSGLGGAAPAGPERTSSDAEPNGTGS